MMGLDIENTPAYKAGYKAASLGVPIEQSGLKNINFMSDQYDWYIAGYESFSMKNKGENGE